MLMIQTHPWMTRVSLKAQNHGGSAPGASRCGRTAEQPFSNELVDLDHESSNRCQPEGQRRRWQEPCGQRDERCGRTLSGGLVEKPPEEHREVHQIEETAQRGGQRRLRRVCRMGNRLLEDLLDPHP